MNQNSKTKEPPSPFSCSFSPNLPELLQQLNCTIAISTFQAGKVIFISPKNNEELIQLPRTFNRPMGLALKGNKMTIACKDEVILLANSPELAVHYPNQPNTYDALYMPRATYYTGQVDIHDMDWGKDGLLAVNTSFSSICKINEEHSFIPVWQPPFITKLVSEDRCHLNGMSVIDGVPKYVTALGDGDTPQGWRENITQGGILMDVTCNEKILTKLPMPHSPRWYGESLYMLLSATGELIRVNLENGTYDNINQLSGFVRGLSIYNDYAFIGLSKLRKNSSNFKDLPIAEKAVYSGVKIVHLPTGVLVAEITYKSSVDEIYDIQVLPDMLRPGILNTEKEIHKMGVTTPGSTFWAKPEEKQQS